MFCTRAVKHKINRPHSRGLKALLNDETMGIKPGKKYQYYYSYQKYSRIDEWILQISPQSFSFHVNILSNCKSEKYSTSTIVSQAAQLWSILPVWY